MQYFKDMQGRVRKIIDGKFDLNEPTKNLDQCFYVENVSWVIEYQVPESSLRAKDETVTWNAAFASASREREFKAAHKEFIFN